MATFISEVTLFREPFLRPPVLKPWAIDLSNCHPKLLLNDNDARKPEGIHFMIERRPFAAFGNSTGDQQMLEYTGDAYPQ